jgi:CheY-like chemotaxis protein
MKRPTNADLVCFDRFDDEVLPLSEHNGVSAAAGELIFTLLNDQPVRSPADDLLNMRDTASGIANMIISSKSASPLVIAIDAGWGMGKSTLLRQIEANLSLGAEEKKIVPVWFNAWTAEEDNALEGLIKSVLENLDPILVRRWMRKLARQGPMLAIVRIGFSIVSRFFGIARLVDELWKQLAVDAATRNKLRDAIHGMLDDWVKEGGHAPNGRCMVVFVDDLDRCSDDVVVKTCEAIKLYLDATGLIFVLACDQSVLARGVSLNARGGADEGRTYLEKIVQVAYRVPPPDEAALSRLIRGYAEKSGTTEIIDDQVEKILAARTNRNPRKIKRLINSFSLEYQLDPAWRQPPLSCELLMTAILLQHLYTPFYDLLVRDEAKEDPIGELIDYSKIRERVSDPPMEQSGIYWTTMNRALRDHGLHVEMKSKEHVSTALKMLEEKLPEEFLELVNKDALIMLLSGIGDREVRVALRAQLIRRPLATEPIQQDPRLGPDHGRSLVGARIVCVDDNPESLDPLVDILESLGAIVLVCGDPIDAEREIFLKEPDAVISDITRGDDPNAGFTYASQLRAKGYLGPLVFFTARITQERRRRAMDLHATDIVTGEFEVVAALTRPARWPPVRSARRTPGGPGDDHAQSSLR